MDRTYLANDGRDDIEREEGKAGGHRPAEERRSGVDRRRHDRGTDDRLRKAHLTPQEIAALLQDSRRR